MRTSMININNLHQELHFDRYHINHHNYNPTFTGLIEDDCDILETISKIDPSVLHFQIDSPLKIAIGEFRSKLKDVILKAFETL